MLSQKDSFFAIRKGASTVKEEERRKSEANYNTPREKFSFLRVRIMDGKTFIKKGEKGPEKPVHRIRISLEMTQETASRLHRISRSKGMVSQWNTNIIEDAVNTLALSGASELKTKNFTGD